MSVELHFNGQRTSVTPGSSLFDYAESLGVQVPTSCRKQGKCKECVVEVIEGMECLSQPVPAEKHLESPFRLSCSLQNRCRFRRCPLPHDAARGDEDRTPRVSTPDRR